MENMRQTSFRGIHASAVPAPSLQQNREHKADYGLILVLGVIIVFGLIMLSSASSVVAFQKFGDTNYYIKHQLLYGILVGIVAFFVTSNIDYHFWRRYAFIFMVATLLLLVLVLIPGIGYEYLGARRWINIGGILFQPTELAKLTFLIYLCTWLEKKSENKNLEHLSEGLLAFLTLLGVMGLLVMLQPDLGTMTVIAFISLVVFFIAGAPWKHLTAIGIGGAVVFAILVKIAPYRADRLTVFLNPQLDPQGIGYHINQALLAIGSGGIFGLGLGRSRQKYNYLPEVTGDSIFAVMAEELGFILAVGLIILFVLFMIRGLNIARKAPDTFGKLLASGITLWVMFQAFVNMGAMLSLLPLTGIPLPFVSYGSSSTLMLLIAFGVLINISKHTKE